MNLFTEIYIYLFTINALDWTETTANQAMKVKMLHAC